MLSSLRGFWSRHRRKVLISLGVAGSAYAAYRLYGAHRRRLLQVEQLAEAERAAEERDKNRLQTLFEITQRTSETTSLPVAMGYLRLRIMEDLDHTQLTEKLMQGKEQSGVLSTQEKLETWERLKFLSFTKTVSSLWAMTLLSLYVRVQTTILVRHLYLDLACGTDGAHLQVESVSDNNELKEYLGTAEYLPTYAINALIMNMEHAATEILKQKELKDRLSMDEVCQTMVQILDLFMSLGEENSWINYLIPENATLYALMAVSGNNGFDDSSVLKDVRKLDQLMSEIRVVLSSPDFRNIVGRSLRKVAHVLIEDMTAQIGSPIPPTGLPLVKLVARVAQLSRPLLEEPKNNKYIQIIRSMPEVELFYTLLFANMPPET